MTSTAGLPVRYVTRVLRGGKHNHLRNFWHASHHTINRQSQSDILGRHTAIHNPRERRNDNPQRRRACHECARVRERCSRGEPCRRCAIKALHCLYPDEPPSKVAMPHSTWSSSTSETGDYDATSAGVFDPQLPLGTQYTGGDALLHVQGCSQWQIEDSPVSYGGPSTPSVLRQKGFNHYQPSNHETSIAPFFRHDALSPSDQDLYPRSANEGCPDPMKFIISDTEQGAVLGAYDQTTNPPSELSSSLNQMGLHQSSSSVEFQGDYSCREACNTQHANIAFAPDYTHNSSAGMHTAVLGQSEILDSSMVLEGYESLAGVHTPTIDFDGHESLSQTLQTPYGCPVDLKAYDFMTTPFAEPPQ